MLSILVPVYNFDVRKLITEAVRQAENEKIEFEVLVFDDGSNDDFKAINRALENLPEVEYRELPENIGRSRIRNYLAEKAKYNNLLFMDCDSEINSPDYIKNYLPFCDAGNEYVVYGGREYHTLPPTPENLHLHWFYGRRREVIPAEIRQKNPDQSFMTNNFLITRSIFNKITFNEKLKGYGHEDTLFGFELGVNKKVIIHINNPLIHIGLEDSKSFVQKSKEGIHNLKKILKVNGEQKKLVKDISLLGYYNIIRTLKAQWLVKKTYNIFSGQIERNLYSKNPSLTLFDFYKLGYLCSIEQE